MESLGNSFVPEPQHPLLNSVVLKVLFQYQFSFEDLQKMRLVCRDWYQASLKQWRSLAAVNLGPVSSPFLCTANQLNVLSYFEFLKSSSDFYQFARYPYQKYTIKSVDFTHSEVAILLRETPDSCWNLVAPLVKKLRFEKCIFQRDQHVFDEILPHRLANLQSLSSFNCISFPIHESQGFDSNYYQDTYNRGKSKLKNVNLKNFEIFGVLPADLSELLFSAPNLEVFRFYTGDAWPGLYIALFRISAIKARANEQLKIRELQLNLSIENIWDTPYLSRNPELPVERVFFSVTAFKDMCFKTGFYNSNTLKTLELCRFLDYTPMTWDLFREGFRSLKELYFYKLCLANFNVLNWLSSLEVFYIDMNLYSSMDRVVEATSDPESVAESMKITTKKISKYVITKLTTISLPLTCMKRFHIDQDLHIESWKKVAEWMPNLETLEVILNAAGFQRVCRHLPNLKGLVLLHGSRINDSVLTGVTRTDRNPDNITALEQLQTFRVQRLCGKPDCKSPPECRLEDQSIYNGFLEMANLQTVSIHAKRMMSIDAETALRRRIPNVQVIRNYTNAKGDHNSECCKVRDFLRRYPQQN